MVTDYLFFKILILIALFALLIVGYLFLSRFVKDAFRKESVGPLELSKENGPKRQAELSFFNKKVTQYQNEEQHYIAQIKEYTKKIEDLRTKIDALNRQLESGIYRKKHEDVFRLSRNLYVDLFTWTRTQRYALNIGEVEQFLGDIQGMLNSLGVELINPNINTVFDPLEMRAVNALTPVSGVPIVVTEVVAVGFKIKTDDGKYRVIETAQVKLKNNS